MPGAHAVRAKLWVKRTALTILAATLVAAGIGAVRNWVSADAPVQLSPLAPPGQTYVRSAHGQIGTVPAEKYERALSQGYSAVSAGELLADRQASAALKSAESWSNLLPRSLWAGVLIGVLPGIVALWYIVLVMLGQIAAAIRGRE